MLTSVPSGNAADNNLSALLLYLGGVGVDTADSGVGTVAHADNIIARNFDLARSRAFGNHILGVETDSEVIGQCDGNARTVAKIDVEPS